MPDISLGAGAQLRMALIAGLVLLLLAIAAAVAGSLVRLLPAQPIDPLAIVRGGELFVSDTDPSTMVRISARGDIPYGAGAPSIKAAFWSPNGRYLAVALGQQDGDPLWHGLAWLTSDGAVVGTMNGTAADVAWTPDGERLVVLPLSPGAGNGPLVVGLDAIDHDAVSSINTERAHSLLVAQPGLPFAFGWHPSGRAIVAVRDVNLVDGGFQLRVPNEVSIWLADASGAEVARPIGGIHQADSDVAAAVAPNGLAIAVVSVDATRQPAAVFRIVAPNGQDICSQPLDSGQLHGAFTKDVSVAWNADSQRIAIDFARDDGSELWVASAACDSQPTLLVGSTTTGVVTTDNSGVVAGAESLRVLSGEAVNGPIEWSHDGQWIYYRGLTLADQTGSGFEHFDLRRIATDGGISQPVASAVEWFDLEPPPSPSEPASSTQP